MKFRKMSLGLYAVLIISALIVAPISAWAKSPVNKNWRGVAIKGYDPVAYFTLGKPLAGKKEYEYQWQDAKWLFANEDHLSLFSSDPEKYAPQYGGY